MNAQVQQQKIFHLTGSRSGEDLTWPAGAELRPALLAGYRDLARLRYDFPLVLPEPEAGADYVHSLSQVVDALLAERAPRGPDGERLRAHVRRVERELRAMLARGAAGTLSDLWPVAAKRIGAQADTTAVQVLLQEADSLAVDGELADCDAALPARFLLQAWRSVQARKRREFRVLVDGLIRKLSDILRAAFAHSAAGRQPKALRCVGRARVRRRLRLRRHVEARGARRAEGRAAGGAPPPHRVGAGRAAPRSASTPMRRPNRMPTATSSRSTTARPPRPRIGRACRAWPRW